MTVILKYRFDSYDKKKCVIKVIDQHNGRRAGFRRILSKDKNLSDKITDTWVTQANSVCEYRY
jgi:hypothetical protein